MKKSKIEKIYRLRTSFSIIGLTGRTGSGVSKVAEILSSSFSDIEKIQPLKTVNISNKSRKYNISFNYSKENWKTYKVIQYKYVILLHIIRKSNQEVENFFSQNKYTSGLEKEIIDLFDKNIELISRVNNIKRIDKELKDNNELIELSSIFFSNDFEKIALRFNTILEKSSIINRINFLHEIANNIRKCGDCFNNKDEDELSIFKIAETINRLIKGYKLQNEETHIVIDSLRNSIEIMFFKERYSAFYMVSINSEHRRKFLLNRYKCEDLVNEILKIDDQEYEGKGVSNGDFFVQDVRNCIQKSDIHFNYNPPTEDRNKSFEIEPLIEKCDYYLIGQIIKYTGLILHPGLITPSAQERCMQIAYVSKSNSGCISRQVGAVITDVSFSIKAIGWNDVPSNSTPCLLRNSQNLIDDKDLDAYSPYEKDEKYDFIKPFKNYYSDLDNSKLDGLNCSYCFKDFQNSLEKKENQVHTRSLHAEENAMLQISKNGGTSLKNGILFTTASPCELCSKKARQLEITQIYYIDPYPGISKWHILRDGTSVPELILYSGAVGKAYHKLYDPVMSYKDELALITNKRPKKDLHLYLDKKEAV